MIWNDHSRDIPEGAHALLGASQHSWLNYDESKLIEVCQNRKAKERGTRLHKLAKELIDEKIILPAKKETFNMYVNDAIRFGLRTEQGLWYSPNSFGTADAIGYFERKKILRIHDLKTGKTPASLVQLEVYAALFCLEYHFKPSDFNLIELRIYQNNDILIGQPGPDIIVPIMDTIITDDKIIDQLEEEML